MGGQEIASPFPDSKRKDQDLQGLYDRNRTFFPLRKTPKKLWFVVGCFYYLCCSNATCVLFQEKKVPLRRFSACRLYWRVSFHYVWGPKTVGKLQSTPLRLARKSPGTNRDDCCLVITLVAKKKMKVSDIYWGTSVWNFNLGFVWFHIYMHFGLWIPTTYFKVSSYHEVFGKLSHPVRFWCFSLGRVLKDRKIARSLQGTVGHSKWLAKIGTLWWIARTSHDIPRGLLHKYF